MRSQPPPTPEQTVSAVADDAPLGKNIDPDPETEIGLLEWFRAFNQHSQLLMAVLDVATLNLKFANDHFYCLLGVTHPEQPDALADQSLLSHLTQADRQAVIAIFRRHILKAALAYYYPGQALLDDFCLREPLIVTFAGASALNPRQVELRLSSNQLRLVSLHPDLESALARCFPTPPTRHQVMAQLLNPGSPLMEVLHNLDQTRYQASGVILIEGTDVTDREVAKRLTHLLIDQESILKPEKLSLVHSLIKTLFRADTSLILSAENQQAKLFTHLDQPEWTIHTYPFSVLQDSFFFQAADQGKVLNVPDLELECPTPCEAMIAQMGMRSLLIIPLVIKSNTWDQSSRKLLGVVGLAAKEPYIFNQFDCRHAEMLIPPLTAAMRHTSQYRFTNIHPSVRWRFEQEAERRSWGLPPETITFTDVYPLYGISDIRGSSSERNRAIQTDLLTQFQLALDIVDAVCAAQANAYTVQFRHDLQDYINQLQQGITVEAEVTLNRYLAEHLEGNFDYFRQFGEAAQAAIHAYQQACENEQQCVYTARAAYDETINHINTLLRQTWEQWQQTMQTVTQHYADIEATDGIDHMIYAGKSIDPTFTDFHLRSLRYDQLRAVCDCARVAFTLKETCNTDMTVTHLVLVQDTTVDISHDEHTERLFDVRGSRDTRYEIVKKRIDKALDMETQQRITQPGMLTIVYSTENEWREYSQYIRYLQREEWVDTTVQQGDVEPLQGVSGLKFARLTILPAKSPADISPTDGSSANLSNDATEATIH